MHVMCTKERKPEMNCENNFSLPLASFLKPEVKRKNKSELSERKEKLCQQRSSQEQELEEQSSAQKLELHRTHIKRTFPSEQNPGTQSRR